MHYICNFTHLRNRIDKNSFSFIHSVVSKLESSTSVRILDDVMT